MNAFGNLKLNCFCVVPNKQTPLNNRLYPLTRLGHISLYRLRGLYRSLQGIYSQTAQPQDCNKDIKSAQLVGLAITLLEGFDSTHGLPVASLPTKKKKNEKTCQSSMKHK